VEQIEDAVRGLFCDELAAFPRRFAEFDGVLWDRQIEEEVAAGSRRTSRHRREDSAGRGGNFYLIP
jgi:hypothetical protein